MTAVLEDVRHLPDADLIGAYRAADDVLAEAILSEAARRDRADRMAKARRALDAIRHDAECAVHAQYLAASEWTPRPPAEPRGHGGRYRRAGPLADARRSCRTVRI